jgi:hypothetical protein
MLADVLDRVIDFAARDEVDLVRAKAHWAERAGQINDDDELYEERTTAFLEWFALERRPDGASTGVERLLASADEKKDEFEARWLVGLARSHRSLFRVEELEEGAIWLADLLGGTTFIVTERRRLAGVEKGQVFEARLVPNLGAPPELLFSRAFQFHPSEAQPALVALAESARKARRPRQETLFQLMRLRLRALRYRHVSADRIYLGEEHG